MTFDPRLYDEAFVWIWLPDATSPIVAGRLSVRDQRVAFNYGRSYLDRPDAISLYTPELPLVSGLSAPEAELHIAGCIDDAAPDSWGQLIVANSLQMSIPNRALNAEERLAFLLESGSDRIGALDFQRSPSDYQPRNNSDDMQLHSLQEAAEQLMRGEQLQPDLEQALIHGSSSGGAHPKVSVTLDGQKYIAKFTLSNTLYNLVGAEFMAMRLAALCGLNVADVQLTQVDGRQTLLVRRFDRTPAKDEGYKRKSLVSALTILGLDEMHARYASYEDLAEKIRAQFKNPTPTLRELFGRLVFNILCSNTDDHARNHAAFWDGRALELTPAYDICPQPRTGGEASQAMLIAGSSRLSRLSTCLQSAHTFRLSQQQASDLIEAQISTIGEHWQAVCDLANLPASAREAFLGRQFFNPYAFEDLPQNHLLVQAMRDAMRKAG